MSTARPFAEDSFMHRKIDEKDSVFVPIRCPQPVRMGKHKLEKFIPGKCEVCVTKKPNPVWLVQHELLSNHPNP